MFDVAARRLTFAAAVVFSAALPRLALAQTDILSADTVHGVVDLRGEWADGEPSFTEGGFGKSRYGGGAAGGDSAKLQIADAALEWTPRIGWDLSAVVDLVAQPSQEHAIDLGQAYFVYKPVPTSATRFSLRGGLYYPPISLEHDARAWGITDTITPSAINTWVGEEVKVVGLEANVSTVVGDQAVKATAAVFGYDDTSGTLLSFRGWGLHDLQSQANGSFPLPPLSSFIARVQDDETYSTLEIDRRAGFYGRLEWTPTPPLTLHAFYYDNAGDRVSVTPDLQWAWKTRFWEAGGRWDLDEHTKLQAQALIGSTVMGFDTPGGRFVDMDFRSIYLLATRDVGKSAFTGRVDLFDTHDRSSLTLGDTNEHGWALTAAWRYPLSRTLDVRLEAMHIESDRPSRALAGDAPDQPQTVLQSSLRLTL
jgi:hypothetical protein